MKILNPSEVLEMKLTPSKVLFKARKYGEGTIRTHGGKKVRKKGGKWVPVAEGKKGIKQGEIVESGLGAVQLHGVPKNVKELVAKGWVRASGKKEGPLYTLTAAGKKKLQELSSKAISRVEGTYDAETGKGEMTGGEAREYLSAEWQDMSQEQGQKKRWYSIMAPKKLVDEATSQVVKNHEGEALTEKKVLQMHREIYSLVNKGDWDKHATVAEKKRMQTMEGF